MVDTASEGELKARFDCPLHSKRRDNSIPDDAATTYRTTWQQHIGRRDNSISDDELRDWSSSVGSCVDRCRSGRPIDACFFALPPQLPGMTSTPSDDELAERVAELEATLEQLRREIRRPPTGPLGLPRPPTPRELLELTDRYAIPTAIAVLEANVRALELLQRLIRLADTERAAEAEADRMRSRAEAISRVTLDQLDGVLEELQEGALPREPESRQIIEDARQLRTELREWLAEGERTVADGTSRERELTEQADEPDGTNDAADGVEIDVDEELRSIRAELEEDRTSIDEPNTDRSNDRSRNDGAGDGDSTEGKSATDESRGRGSTGDGSRGSGVTGDGSEDGGPSSDGEPSNDGSGDGESTGSGSDTDDSTESDGDDHTGSNR